MFKEYSFVFDIDGTLCPIKKKDEIGDLSRVTVTLRDAMQSTIKEITSNAKALLDASQLLGAAADTDRIKKHK